MASKLKLKKIKGYTEQQVWDIIEYVIDYLKKGFSFGYYDEDDIAQECRIFALEALKRFDPKKSQLQTFLETHMRNRLITLKRDKLMRNDSPCRRCKHYINDQCVNHNKKSDCKRWLPWYSRNDTKRNIMQLDCEIIREDVELLSMEKPVGEIYDKKELYNLILDKIPSEFRRDFLKLGEGAVILKFRRDRLMAAIRKIVSENYGETDWE